MIRQYYNIKTGGFQLNMKQLFLLGLLITLSGTTTTFFSPISPQISLYGRYYFKDNAVAYDWSCFKIEFCFQESTKVVMALQDSWNIYQIIQDDKPTKKIQPKKIKQTTLFESTKPQSHCLQIVKITENHYGPLASYKDSLFQGIELTGGQLKESKHSYSYRFQFLGDSITTAFGVLGSRNPICMLRMKQIQNCLQNWAVHLSKMFTAQYRVEAVSGKGVIKNQIGITGKKMPKLFTQITDNTKPNTYKLQDKYVPDVLFLFIGANDYSNPYKPNPRNFIQGYKDMVQSILYEDFVKTNKGSIVINVCDIEFSSELCDNVKTAVRQYGYGYDKMFYVQIPEGTLPKQNMGCIGHPNAKGQRAIAEALYPKVKDIIQSVKNQILAEN